MSGSTFAIKYFGLVGEKWEIFGLMVPKEKLDTILLFLVSFHFLTYAIYIWGDWQSLSKATREFDRKIGANDGVEIGRIKTNPFSVLESVIGRLETTLKGNTTNPQPLGDIVEELKELRKGIGNNWRDQKKYARFLVGVWFGAIPLIAAVAAICSLVC